VKFAITEKLGMWFVRLEKNLFLKKSSNHADTGASRLSDFG
jgi:hypothetical protein